MLSLSKLSGTTPADVAKAADYPRESDKSGKQAGSQAEDYYAAGGAPSMWMGTGAAALGLVGTVDREAVLNVMQGLDLDAHSLVQGSGSSRRYGTDLTFSAPKSVSLAWGLGDQKTRQQIEDAQRRAVAATIKYIEDEFRLARRGSGGYEHEQARLVAAVYQHGSSREQDLNLHNHCVLMNLGLRNDGSWGAIEFGEIYRQKMYLGAVYRAALAEQMQSLGFQIEADTKGTFRIVGSPKNVEREFSQRRGQIEEEMARTGHVGGKAAEVAALSSRRGKELTDASELHEEWQKRAQVLGFTREDVEALRTHQRAPEPGTANILSSLTQNQSTFDLDALRMAAMVAAGQHGLGIEAAHALEEACKAQAVQLRAPDGSRHFTTREILEIERAVVESGNRLSASDQAEAIPAAIVAAAVEKFEALAGFRLYDEQRAALEYMMGRGAIKLIQGDAGAGKTTISDSARMAWENAGFRVLGCSLGGKASSGLQRDAGIEESSTLDSLLMRLDRGTEILDAKTVVVMDEAGTTGARHMDRLLKHVEQAGARLVLIGDTKQLAAVAAGTPFRDLQKSGREVFHLKQNNRQIVEKLERVQALIGEGKTAEARKQLARHGLKIKDVPQALAEARGMRAAVNDAAAGDIKQAMQKLVENKAVSIAAPDRGLAATVEKWAARGGELRPQETLMLAATRASVAKLNEAALVRLREKNFLGPSVTTTVRDREGNSLGQREFAEGGRIIFKKTDLRGLGVSNGELGTIRHVEHGKTGPILTIQVDGGKVVKIEPDAPRPEDWRAAKAAPGLGYSHIEHGFAMTVHSAQGVTVDRAIAFVDGGPLMSRELAYVELSRVRISTDVVFSTEVVAREEAAHNIDQAEAEPDLERVKKIVERMEKGAEKTSTLDFEVVNEAPQKSVTAIIETEAATTEPQRITPEPAPATPATPAQEQQEQHHEVELDM